MSRALNHFKSNVVAYLALFVSLGGTSYAAATLGAGSVGTRQLKNHSVTPVKLQKGSIAGYVRDWAQIDAVGRISGSRPRAHLVSWNEGPGGVPGGVVSWGEPIPRACFAVATAATLAPAPRFASAVVLSAGKKTGHLVGVQVRLSAPQTAVAVAVICPQP
jgi:hypothetical protein